MPDLQPFNSGETATSVRTKINAAIQRINTLDDANEIIAKIDTELGSTSWKDSVLTTDTLATLAAIDVGFVANNSVVIVYGGVSAGDGEGGSYYWDQSSTQTPKGSTVIAPDSGDNGRWMKIQTALSGVDIKAEIVEADTFDTSLADIGAIKDWVDQNSTVSDLEYVGITSYDGTPSRVGTTGTVSGLSYTLAANATGEKVTYNIKDLKSNLGEISNIRLLHVEVSMLMGNGSTDKIVELKVSFPDGSEQVLLANNWNGIDAVIADGHKNIAVVPVNADTTTITFEAKIDSNNVRESIAYTIVGATRVNNASGLLGSQLYGGSGMRHSGAEVYNDAAPTAYEELNLKQYTDKGGRTFVFLKVDGDAAYEFRTNGETEDGGGTAASTNAAGDVSYISIITDADTILEWKADSAATTTITLEAFQPLDDAPVITRHYLGDIEFINGVNIVTESDDINNDTAWQTVQPNIAWAGASTLLIHCATQDNDFNSNSNYIKFRTSPTSSVTITDGGEDNTGGRDSQMLIPVNEDGSFQWRYYGNDSKLQHIKVVGYISGSPLSNASYPYWNVTVDNRNNLTTIAEFTDGSQDTLATFREPSYGTIFHGYNQTYIGGANSLMYSMQVNVLEETVIEQSLFALDDALYIIAPKKGTTGGLGPDEIKWSTTSGHSSVSAPWNISYTLYPGLQTIYYIKNDSGSIHNNLALRGDIIGDKVLFVGFSGTTGIVDNFSVVDHETVPTSQAVKTYVDTAGGRADFISTWAQVVEDDTNFNVTHNLDTQDLHYIMQLKFPNGQVTQLNPALTYPYHDNEKPEGISVMIEENQFRCRSGRGLITFRHQAGEPVGAGSGDGTTKTGHGIQYIDYNDSRTGVLFRIIAYKI